MFKSFLGEKIAVLVANGFSEQDLTHTQRALQKFGANMRIISMDHGLVNSWNGAGWGLHFAADKILSSALAADFSILIVPGGRRSIEKLKLTAHTRRFLNGFIDAGKPVVLFDDAADLLAYAEKMSGRTITGPAEMKAAAQAAGAQWLEAPYAIDQNIMTGAVTPETLDEFVAAAVEFLVACYPMNKAA